MLTDPITHFASNLKYHTTNPKKIVIQKLLSFNVGFNFQTRCCSLIRNPMEHFRFGLEHSTITKFNYTRETHRMYHVHNKFKLANVSSIFLASFLVVFFLPAFRRSELPPTYMLSLSYLINKADSLLSIFQYIYIVHKDSAN